jgi:DNA-binding response OmpR family regulator
MLADDDLTVSKVLGLYLEKGGYAVMHAYSGAEVLQKVAKSRPDILLMDVLLGDADGRDLCRRLRSDGTTRHIPIILISAAKTEEEDQVSGLRGGADDYLVKPVEREILLAKLEAVLRRSRAPQELQDILKRYGLVLNVSDRTAKLGRKEIVLTRKEFDLLTVLLRNSGKVSSPEYLLETVWGYETEDYNDPRTVQVHISRLKKKLGKGFASHIKNVIGSGYILA